MKNIYLETEYIVTITKSSNEELNIQDKDGKKYANAYRTYKISGIPKTFSAEGKEIVMDVLNNPGWVASVYNTDGDLSIESDLNQQIIKDMINDQDGDDYWDEGNTEVNFVGELDDLGYVETPKNDILNPPQDHQGHPDIYDMDIIAIKATLSEVSVCDEETYDEIYNWTYEDGKASNEGNLKETLKIISEME